MENTIDKKISDLLKNSSILGTIGSPSSTIELALDIWNPPSQDNLWENGYFKFTDSKNHYAIGQIIEIH